MDEISTVPLDDIYKDEIDDKCDNVGADQKMQEHWDEGDGRWPFGRRPLRPAGSSPVPSTNEQAQAANAGYIERAFYKMNHPRRGVFIIINNRTFHPNTKQRERTGTDVDASNLYTHFKSLGFECRINSDKTTTEILKIFKDVSDEDHRDADCFGCAFLSHGDMGIVYGTDGIIAVETLTSLFRGDHCPSLAGKPKLFIIQACRGHKLDEGVIVADSPSGEEYIKRLPAEADFLLAYSTVPGYFSWRNTRTGSWFVQALCRVLNQTGVENLEIMQLFTQVNRLVAYEFESRIPTDPAWDRKKQIPSIVSMLTKELYLTKK